MEFLIGQPKEIVEYDEVLVRRLIDNITASDEGLVVGFKSGLKMGVNEL